ncbi:hypothetical protein [Plantactinospora sp. B5E13]|uniref:esterase/lipase family protein n=1 Tax=unclassified Plantactinospora TaxID=2631981 RepID=UPI00325E5F17
MPALARDVSRDAVIVVPGIMGSELVDADTGRVLWGLTDPRWYVSAWASGRGLAALRVTEAELAGTGPVRVRATGLLRTPAFAPVLRGVEPYRDLLRGVRAAVAHPDAVVAFPYDWRLPVARSASALADVASAHLRRWRAHPEGRPDARLVIVAHSMGGLVARYFTSVLGGADLVRAMVTLGTPFFGAAKAVQLLAAGRGGPLPLPRQRLRELAVTLPGVYDLLPTYRCVDEGTGSRLLGPADIAAIGADVTLAEQAALTAGKLAGVSEGPELHAVVGVGQPTVQSLRIRSGVVEPCHHTCEPDGAGGLYRVDRMGDSTVYRDAAGGPGSRPAYLPQSHATLARSQEAVAHVRSVITQRPLGPPLGVPPEEAVGVDLPDVVVAGEPFPVTVLAEDPAAVSCRVVDVTTEEIEALPRLAVRDGALAAVLALPRPGLYRVEAAGGSFSPVAQLMLVLPPAGTGDGLA